ncbi:unnamed protein product [Spirodela intermedia]|uniref:DRBM domain-containing protein n=1 Tax=Spirodela intermedia TaxID=51605 RepID=A0A7I8K160_SPIIN|nr:unnamed protein product [Spirodela intermedia]
MYKNQLQELAQRSCFNLPSYSCIREGPDHAPRFKATVNFNGETFESPGFCTTLRQAEHAAAEVALNALSTRGPSNSLAARILDETGVYKNLLQEIAQRVGAPLPSYTTVRSGLGHLPVFTGTVELAGITFTGEPAKNKKQAEKNAAMAAWYSLKQLVQQVGSSSSDPENNNEEQQQITAARALLNYRLKEKMAAAGDHPNSLSFPRKFPIHPEKRPSLQPGPSTGSKILPLIRPKSTPRTRPPSPSPSRARSPSHLALPMENYGIQLHKFPAVGAAPYVPIRHCRHFHGGVAPPVTIRTAVPVFSAPPLPPPSHQRPPPVICSPRHVAPPVHIRRVVPVLAAAAPSPAPPPMLVQVKEPHHPPVFMAAPPPPPPPAAAPTVLTPPKPASGVEDVRFPSKQILEKEMTLASGKKPLTAAEEEAPAGNPSRRSSSTTPSEVQAGETTAEDPQERSVIQGMRQIQI